MNEVNEQYLAIKSNLAFLSISTERYLLSATFQYFLGTSFVKHFVRFSHLESY